MRITDLANLQNETDWVLSPTLVGLIFGILGAIATISTSAPNILNQSSNIQSTGSELATGINDADFNRALPHILKWEGTCSDHPRDKGGRTYKGVTWKVALKHGFKGDVCTMADQQVYQIYYKDYWARVPKNKAFPEKLAYFNMLVNGTSPTCLAKSTAKEMLDCQSDYYKGLRDRDVFGDGWENRNNYIKSVVQ